MAAVTRRPVWRCWRALLADVDARPRAESDPSTSADGQLQPVAVAAQSSMKWTFRIASVHCASGDAVRESCRVGTRGFGALLPLAPPAPGRRPCRLSWLMGLLNPHHHGSRRTWSRNRESATVALGGQGANHCICDTIRGVAPEVSRLASRDGTTHFVTAPRLAPRVVPGHLPRGLEASRLSRSIRNALTQVIYQGLGNERHYVADHMRHEVIHDLRHHARHLLGHVVWHRHT
jgi:hypothetical protein